MISNYECFEASGSATNYSLQFVNLIESHSKELAVFLHCDFLLSPQSSSLLCNWMWFFKFVCLLNPLSHISHLNGQVPVCIYMWDFRSPGVGNDFAHSLHLWGLSWNNVCYWLVKMFHYFLPWYVSSCDNTNLKRLWKSSHKPHIYEVFLQCEFFCVCLDCYL